jgi:hypothetical protein
MDGYQVHGWLIVICTACLTDYSGSQVSFDTRRVSLVDLFEPNICSPTGSRPPLLDPEDPLPPTWTGCPCTSRGWPLRLAFVLVWAPLRLHADFARSRFRLQCPLVAAHRALARPLAAAYLLRPHSVRPDSHSGFAAVALFASTPRCPWPVALSLVRACQRPRARLPSRQCSQLCKDSGGI